MPLFKTLSQRELLLVGYSLPVTAEVVAMTIILHTEGERKKNFCYRAISENSLPSCDVNSSGYLCTAKQTMIPHTGGRDFLCYHTFTAQI